MHLPDYYRILGISETASPGEIKAAFRKLTLKYHPDRNPGDKEAIEIFSAIHTAYMVLSDPEKRRDYDLKRPGNHGVIFKDIPVRAVTDRSKIKIMVDKRVVLMGESVRVLISIFENNNKTIVSGLHRFDVVEGPAINSLFPPGPDSPEIEIAYVLKPKEAGYMEIGPASIVSGGTRYLSESVYIKVNPSPDLVKMRPVSRIEKVQSAVVSSLIIFYSFLIGYNVYQFKIFPFMGNFDTPMQPGRLSLGDFRLATGDSPYEDYYGRGKFDQSAFNRVVFRNGKSLDAVVLLIDLQSDEIIRNSYIRADEDFTMQHLPDGKYYLKVLFGNDWNDTMRVMKNTGITGGFNRNARFEIFQQEVNIIHMQHSRSGDTLDYKVYEITLYPVQNSNAESISTDSENFFN